MNTKISEYKKNLPLNIDFITITLKRYFQSNLGKIEQQGKDSSVNIHPWPYKHTPNA